MRPSTPPFTLSRDADAFGTGRRALARAVTDQELARLRRGVHVRRSALGDLRPDDRHLLRMRAVDLTVRRRLVFSHWSAAAAHGLPTLGIDDRVHVCADAGSNHRIVDAIVHRTGLRDDDVLEMDGLLCTSLARTVVDIACSAPFAHAVAVADSALHAVPEELREEMKQDWRDTLARSGVRRSARKALDVIDFADGDSGSVAESFSRVTMRVLRLPRPVLQQRFLDARGFVADVDFWFPGVRGVGEVDGRVKYADLRMNGGDPARVVYREKLREDRVRALVEGFTRWDYATARSPQLLGPLLARIGVIPVS